MTKRQKKNLIRICIALVSYLVLLILDKALPNDITGSGIADGANALFNTSYGWLLTLTVFFIVYLYIGYDVLKKAILNIAHGHMLDEAFLMAVATVGAFALGIVTAIRGEDIEGFDEACAVLIFYQVGEWFQGYAVGKSRKSITSLMNIRPDVANVVRENGEIEEVDPDEVTVGDIIEVRPGEKIPLDGIVVDGDTSLDTKALTGESLPRDISKGAEVISGCVNLTSTIRVQVEKAFYDSTVSKILSLVEEASEHKSKAENFITKFARYYTPSVVIAALLLAIIPSIITKDPMTWIYKALNFLVVSCPCALVISIPLSFFAGIGASSKYGILVKGSNYLELFDKANIFVFDKTGTLTKGNFAVTKVVPEDRKEEILKLAAIAERESSHPIARSIVNEYGKAVESKYTLTNIAGSGIKAVNGKDVILCGNEKLMTSEGITFDKEDGIGTVVYVAKNNEYVGSILISDEVKPEAIETIQELNALGCKTIMLTGDNEKIASHVAKTLGLTAYKASLLPQNKVEEVENILKTKDQNDIVCFVGDGINDAPVLMRSDIGIAMGGVGSDAAIEASDIVLMHDNLKGLPLAKKISRKTMKLVYENIAFAIGVKVLIMLVAAIFTIPFMMYISVFGDVGVAVLCILNAMRANSKYKTKIKEFK